MLFCFEWQHTLNCNASFQHVQRTVLSQHSGFVMRKRCYWSRQRLGCLAALAVLAGTLNPAVLAAHEFWIDPVTYTPAVGATVPITFRIGSDFRGDTFPYVRQLDRLLAVTDSRGTAKPATLDGDDPATEVTFATKGLSIIAHERGPEEVVFKDMTIFDETLRDEGLEAQIAEHKTAGKRQTEIVELYTRYAKSLVQVGGGTGKDQAVSMRYQLVADTDPYAHPKGQPFPVRFLQDGKPLAGALVKCFQRDKPDSIAPPPQRVRTDAEGRATCDISRSGEYMISTVHMVPPTASEKADWVSHWATLSFARP
jgi:hypothetical protein